MMMLLIIRQLEEVLTSVNKVWSNAHGVLIGDYIYSKAFMLNGSNW